MTIQPKELKKLAMENRTLMPHQFSSFKDIKEKFFAVCLAIAASLPSGAPNHLNP